MTDERGIDLGAEGSASPLRARGGDPLNTPYRENAHAVVIGIDRYLDPKIPTLRYACADAESVYAVLTDPDIGRFNPKNVTLLRDAEATRKGIVSAIGTQLPRRASSDSTVCIYYAGHGAPFLDPAVRSVDGIEKYLIPHDAEAEDLPASAISMDSVQQWFGRIKAGQLIFFLDSCYSGVAGGRSFEIPGFQTRALLSDEFLDHLGDEGRFVVTACATNEVSLETAALGHGLFTHYLVEGMKGAADRDQNGLVTIDELYDYVYRNVNRAAREMGGSMTPIRKGSVSGTVYLTQYETATQKRIREATGAAEAAYDGGDLPQAGQLWAEVLRLDATNARARAGLGMIAEREGEEVRKREEEDRQTRKLEQRKRRVLIGHLESGAFSPDEYAACLKLLGKTPALLLPAERRAREYLEFLVEGRWGPEEYLQSVELLTAGRPSGGEVAPATSVIPQPSPVSPPSSSVVEETRRRQEELDAKRTADEAAAKAKRQADEAIIQRQARDQEQRDLLQREAPRRERRLQYATALAIGQTSVVLVLCLCLLASMAPGAEVRLWSLLNQVSWPYLTVPIGVLLVILGRQLRVWQMVVCGIIAPASCAVVLILTGPWMPMVFGAMLLCSLGIGGWTIVAVRSLGEAARREREPSDSTASSDGPRWLWRTLVVAEVVLLLLVYRSYRRPTGFINIDMAEPEPAAATQEAPTPSTGTTRLSEVGPGGGQEFSAVCDGDVNQVRVRSAWYVDGIQLGCLGPGGAVVWGDARGGTGGTMYAFGVQPGERIVAVSGSFGAPGFPFVFSLQFHTSNGISSPVYGNAGPTKGGETFRFEIPEGSRSTGLYGHVDLPYLSSIGVIYAGPAP